MGTHLGAVQNAVNSWFLTPPMLNSDVGSVELIAVENLVDSLY